MELNNFYIREDYQIRKENDFLDTSGRSDEYQNDVYLLAKTIAENFDIKKIADVGCGSAFKLKKYFSDYDIIGYDLEPTVNQLNEKYPNNNWVISDFNSTPDEVDLVICADVIEHVNNPDELIIFIKKMNPKYIIISTPDRNLLHDKLGRSHLGPPVNKHHVREWSFEEFKKYMKYHFNVLLHKNFEIEYNQVVNCNLKKI